MFGLAGAARAENILILLADDAGVDVVSTYGVSPQAAPTPNLDALAARGVTFTNAWSHPICAASRASLLTGLPPIEHGLPRNPPPDRRLDPTLPTFADTARLRGYRTFAIGKWHLAGSDLSMAHPLQLGFSHHAGPRNRLFAYDLWEKFVDGEFAEWSSTYATTAAVDDTLNAIASSPEPWLGYVAFNAPHTPLHAPPAQLHGYALAGAPEDDPVTHFRAAMEALDTEIGRLLASIPPEVLARTTVVFAGDNGVPDFAASPPRELSRAKGTAFRGGIEVPLIIAGPAVPSDQQGTQRDQPVQLEDVHATIVDRLGRPDLRGPDAVSLVRMLRSPTFAGRGVQVAQRINNVREELAAQSGCYKLIRFGRERSFAFYDRCEDPEENSPIDARDRNGPERRAASELLAFVPYTPKCRDGDDNDGDGLVDDGDPGCASPEADAEQTACNDGIDNDGDGGTDFGRCRHGRPGSRVHAGQPQLRDRVGLLRARLGSGAGGCRDPPAAPTQREATLIRRRLRPQCPSRVRRAHRAGLPERRTRRCRLRSDCRNRRRRDRSGGRRLPSRRRRE